MIDKCRKRFTTEKGFKYVISDTVDFLLKTKERYDCAYSLWAFSHSVHQTLNRHGFEKGTEKVRTAITKFLSDNLNKNGSFFLIHFDSLSPEQRISMKQRKKDNFVFNDNESQSPSKRLIDVLLAELKATGAIDFTCMHYIGKPLEFYSLGIPSSSAARSFVVI